MKPGDVLTISGEAWRVVDDPDDEVAAVPGIFAIEDPARPGRVGYLGVDQHGNWRAWTPPRPVNSPVRLEGRAEAGWVFTRLRAGEPQS